MSTQEVIPGTDARPTGGENSFYPTPPKLCEAICKTVAELYAYIVPHPATPKRIIEPSAGTGNFVRAARERWPRAHITAVDIVDADVGADAFLWRDWVEAAAGLVKMGTEVDLIIGNPSFPLAVPHIEAAMSVLAPRRLLAFLLRLSFWETPARAELFRKHPVRAFAPIVQRPSFTGGGGDMTGVGLFVWQRGFGRRGEVLPAISWR